MTDWRVPAARNPVAPGPVPSSGYADAQRRRRRTPGSAPLPPSGTRTIGCGFWASSVSLVGTWMQITAQSFLVFELTHSTAYLGYVGCANGVPSWLFMLYGGRIADRVARRTLLVITQSTMLLLALILATLSWLFVNLRDQGEAFPKDTRLNRAVSPSFSRNCEDSGYIDRSSLPCISDLRKLAKGRTVEARFDAVGRERRACMAGGGGAGAGAQCRDRR